MIDFLSINNSKAQNPTTNNTITFSNIKCIKTPPTLSSYVTGGIGISDDTYDIKVYINSTRYYPSTHFSVTLTQSSLMLTFNPINLGFNVTNTDEIIITGKFIDV